MKRRFIIILTLIIAFALFACALSACAETPSSPPSDPPENGTGDDRPTDPDDGHGGGSDGDTDGDTDGDGSGQTDAFSQRALLARLADAFVGGGNIALTADGELRTGDFVIVAEGLTCALDASEGVMMRGDVVRIALTRGEDAFTHSGEFFVGLGEESVAYFEDEETGALRADEDVDAYVIGRYGEELADAATLLTRLATGDLSALLGMGGGLTATGGEAVELIYALADFGGYETGEAGTVERTESGATLTFFLRRRRTDGTAVLRAFGAYGAARIAYGRGRSRRVRQRRRAVLGQHDAFGRAGDNGGHLRRLGGRAPKDAGRDDVRVRPAPRPATTSWA